MATRQMDKLMAAFGAFTESEGLGFEEAVEAFLEEAAGPTKQVSVGTDEEGRLHTRIEEAAPELEMSGRVEAGLKAAGLDARLIRLAARSRDVAEYARLKRARGLE